MLWPCDSWGYSAETAAAQVTMRAQVVLKFPWIGRLQFAHEPETDCRDSHAAAEKYLAMAKSFSRARRAITTNTPRLTEWHKTIALFFQYRAHTWHAEGNARLNAVAALGMRGMQSISVQQSEEGM